MISFILWSLIYTLTAAPISKRDVKTNNGISTWYDPKGTSACGITGDSNQVVAAIVIL